MRLNSVLAPALCASASFIGQVRADAVDDTAEGEAKPSVASVHRPSFTPFALKAPFWEQFTDDWESRWSPSHAKKENDKSSEEEWAYVGTWAVEEPTVYPGLVGDKGLVVKNAAAHHAISAKFGKPIDNTGKTLVVQYEVKLQNSLECGGAYMKLLQDNEALHAEEFSNASPYVIMFGPDKCGATNKVHFIFKHKNPKTGEYEEKHFSSPPVARLVKTTTLYTLIVKPDQTFVIKVDGEQVKEGSLLEDFSPAVNPPALIDDVKDKKPGDWVDIAKIPDPEASKPGDWDEDATYEIVDPTAEKPQDWLDDEPSVVPDPEAEKPEDWDDDEDGDWIPPSVPNPKCDDVSGCGKWEAPMMKNPAYKGKWTAPLIDNPDYKGPWAPGKVPNPDFFEDKTPSNFEPMGAIGFELWTMQSEILFDNIYIGHSVEEAEKIKASTFDVKVKIEEAVHEAEAATMPPPKKPKSPVDLPFLEDPMTFIKEKTELFWAIAKKDPVEAIKFVPEVAGGIAGLAVLLSAILAFLLSSSSSAAPEKVKEVAKKTKDAAVDAKEKVVEAATTGAEKVKTEATKRTTRKAE